jgi:hypothetical protein
MPHIHSNSSRPAIAAIALVLVSLALVACGGSSSTTTTTAASTRPATSKGRFPGAARFAALRECLRKNGISLPQRTPGKRAAPGIGGLLGEGAAPVLPKGVTRARYQAVIKKCGGLAPRRFGPGRSRFNSSEAKKAFAKFAACMRAGGVKLGEPNTSGKGPIFDTKGIDTASAQFQKMERKCQSYLRTAFGGRPGGGAGAGPGAAPPTPAG